MTAQIGDHEKASMYFNESLQIGLGDHLYFAAAAAAALLALLKLISLCAQPTATYKSLCEFPTSPDEGVAFTCIEAAVPQRKVDIACYLCE